MLKLVVLVAVVALVDSTPYELVATGKSCNAANPGWKGSGSSLSACSDLVLADPDCVSDYFILATGDQNCRCASSKTANVDCSQSGNWEDDSAVNLYRTLATAAAETPTASQRANLKLADAHYVTNTKASIAAAELLYKQTVVEFSALFNAGSLLTKSAKKRYNYILAHDSRKPAAEQALLCEDSCSPGGTYTGTGSFAACTANYCDVYQVGASFRNRCTPSDANHGFALQECQKTCGICVDKTPFAASELSFTKTPIHQGRCASALPTSATYTAQSKRIVNPDMGGSVVLVNCADGLEAKPEGDHVVTFLRCDWNANTNLYAWVAHGTCEPPGPSKSLLHAGKFCNNVIDLRNDAPFSSECTYNSCAATASANNLCMGVVVGRGGDFGLNPPYNNNKCECRCTQASDPSCNSNFQSGAGNSVYSYL